MSKLLSPATILAIRDIQLAARTVVDGFLTGMHASRMKGVGLEFSQYRSYQPSDDLRWLDWKMYARSDRYYVRQSEIETSIDIQVVIDASNSMQHTEGGISKIDYARYLAASLGYLSHLQGDATGLAAISNGDITTLAARREASHMARFYYQLEQLQAGGRLPEQASSTSFTTGPHKRRLIVFITDFYEHNAEIMRLLDAFAAMGHEVIAFHLAGEQEQAAQFNGFQAVEDLETGEVLQLDGSVDATRFAQAWQAFTNNVRRHLLEKNIHYRMLSLQSPMDMALRDFLLHYSKIRR
ncbi:DUF58 domain-containing protein [Chitinophaga sp. sic0106]|uniref:DUF58 domain-containing protein n=1 Tax=Chitinophaga sp. sic0106 TaxID=2854785 RepID=UPI001C4829E4|nr:DUF58 domain-containing protein [Chitinophaga sp. sic0106]MBV7531433.1 DUF58 domain-containing protein [Chitinophaga sp. sic0106]